MQMLTKRKKSMEVAQIIDDALKEYYLLQGKPVPNWKCNRNPDWWIKYLRELGLDDNNR